MLRVSICIATHNRREDLLRTLDEIATMEPAADEVLVLADGCKDGTAEAVCSRHPSARIMEHTTAQGSIASRNALAAAASGEILLSLDDDSHPVEKDFVAKLKRLFEARPKLAVVTFPQRSNEFPDTLNCTDFGPSLFVASYWNSGAAIRKSVFTQLGGYPAFFFHAYEEPDFALRCVAAGWQVRYETSLTIRHYYSGSERSELRTHHRHSRNELWSVVLRSPIALLVPVALFRMMRQFRFACTRGREWITSEPRWWADALHGIPRAWAERHPVQFRSYWRWMRLMRAPIESEEEWCDMFPSGHRTAQPCNARQEPS
ncbi:glycosyltransferase family 2 protein [Verrucomicrobiota bacterium sgz303538]